MSPLAELTAAFERIAAEVTARQPDAQLIEILRQAQTLCDAAARMGGAGGELDVRLANLKTAVETWQKVWPRLGGDREFRAAVAREAGLWARKLGELADAR